MGQAKRGRGRPRKSETKLSRWIDGQKLTREEVASRLGIGRTYLDKLCRAKSRPSLELALDIEKLTQGAVPASDWQAERPPESLHELAAKAGIRRALDLDAFAGRWPVADDPEALDRFIFEQRGARRCAARRPVARRRPAR